MHRLIMNDLGPIKHAEIAIDNYIVLTGAQASGKSTIAKAVYYFRTIKEDIQTLIMRKSSSFLYDNEKEEKSFNATVTTTLREKFLNVFGSSWSMDNSMSLEFYYNEKTFVKISLTEDRYDKPNYITIILSKDIKDFLKTQEIKSQQMNGETINENTILFLKQELKELFSDPYDIVYIPAGRSMITLLASQLNYFYISLENAQKRMMDYCTRNYIENIIKVRPEFERGLIGLRENYVIDRKKTKILQLAQENINNILHGSYSYSNGEERLYFNDNKYVKINFASSGQQEVVWILNLLYYALLKSERTFFIIEEPESHLFPEAQKQVMDLVALAANNDNGVMVTTHSPYVLGAVNNQLFASRFMKKETVKASAIVNRETWIQPEDFSCMFVTKGLLSNCLDQELKMIDNAVIDGISAIINEQFDKLSDLEYMVERKDN